MKITEIERVKGASRPLMRNTLLSLLGLCAMCASAQTFDTSATGTVKGDYFVRQVLLSDLDQNTSAIGRARSIIGTMTFDGSGNYSFTGQLMDSQSGSPKTYTATGTYGVSSNGLVQIQNPIDGTDTDFGAVGAAGPSAIVASATEGLYNDIFVAIPAGTGVTNSTLQGSYQAGFIDFTGANAGQVRDGYFTLSSNGNGTFGTVSATGFIANQGSNQTTQSLANVAYSFTNGNGTGTLTFPTSSTPLTALLSGQKNLYYSADGNLLLGGSPSGYDLIFGVKSNSGAVSNSTISGTYFLAALENDSSGLSSGNNFVDSYYGSVNANGQGSAISHLRLVTFAFAAYDYTTSDGYTLQSNGTGTFDGLTTLVGANGQAALLVGTGTFYSMSVVLAAKPVTPSGVFLNPYGIVNSASFAPITNSVAPGEYVTLFGSNLSPVTMSAQSVPFPATLGGVSVTVNNRPAPVYYVSPNQMSVLVPFGTAEGYATFKVTNNGTASNAVTVYTSGTAPGVFTTTANGIGPAAVEHANGSVVSSSNGAAAGETLVAFMTGLGSVTPSVNDGAAAPSSPLSNVDSQVIVELEDQNGNFYECNVVFAGLAPGFVGLYQVNFTVPSNVPAGQVVFFNVGTPDAYTTVSTLNLK